MNKDFYNPSLIVVEEGVFYHCNERAHVAQLRRNMKERAKRYKRIKQIKVVAAAALILAATVLICII